MSLNVALIDKSEIIKKMISHSLHYYSAEVHRFGDLNEFKSQANSIKPDVIFIDWELKQDDMPLAVFANKNIKDTPIVAIYRNEQDKEIKKFPNKIKKPLDPTVLRKVVGSIIAGTNKTSYIHEFLDYPAKKANTKLDASANKASGKDSAEQTKTFAVTDKQDKTTKPASNQTTTQEVLIDRKEVNVDELSFADFGPPAVDSSPSDENTASNYKSSISNKDKDLKESLVKIVLNEYKSSLEFETLVEKTLTAQAEALSQQILNKDHSAFIKKSFTNFKDTDEFKQFFLTLLKTTDFQSAFKQELQKFVKTQMPILAKQIIETEISKILKDIS